MLLPAQSAQERVGSFTTWEGRRQGWQRALAPAGLAQEDWDIVRQLARAMGHDLGWEKAADVRREAAPLMEPAGIPLAQVAALPAPAPVAAPTHADGLAVVALDYLLGRGSMLLGAKDLNATARTPSVWISAADARALDLPDGAVVRVEGARGQIELPVQISAGVAPGTVVVPANSTETPGRLLGPRARLTTV